MIIATSQSDMSMKGKINTMVAWGCTAVVHDEGTSLQTLKLARFTPLRVSRD